MLRITLKNTAKRSILPKTWKEENSNSDVIESADTIFDNS